MTSHAFTAILLSLASLTLAQGRDCYWPDHTLAENSTACNAAAPESACCHTSSACLSNNLCLSQVGYANRITRGACTDNTFNDAACPQNCIEVETNRSVSFFPANISPSPDGHGRFCCVGSYNSSSERCQFPSTSTGSTLPFELDEGSVIVDRSTGATLSDDTSTNSTSGSMATVTAKSDSNVVAVGAGVGASLSVLLIAALIGCAVLYSQLRKARRQLQGIETKGAHQDVPKASEDPNFAPASGQQSAYSDGGSKSYSYGSSQTPAALVESPFNSIVAEAPTEREVAMADSRPVLKP